MSYECCKSGFRWNGTPTGKETTIAGSKTYVSGSNKDVALLMIHDGFGWTLTNNRLLADHFASEANSTCYLPDFFGGEVIAPENIEDPEKRAKFDFPAFLGRNPKELRIKEITAVVKALKQEHGFKKVGAIGHCWGAWACFQLGAKGLFSFPKRICFAISPSTKPQLMAFQTRSSLMPSPLPTRLF